MHLVVVGVGNVGRAIAYTLLHEEYVDELTLVDVIPGLAAAVAEELKHAAASLAKDVRVRGFESCRDVSGADIVVVTAGRGRAPNMSRRDLAGFNAKIMKSVAEEIFDNNRSARYVIVTNPVDAMATLFKKLTGAKYVISSGTHLESIRLRSRIAEVLNVPVSSVEAYVAGEHGPKAVVLWSMTRVDGRSIEEFGIDKGDLESYVKEVSRGIIAKLGATTFGPAAAVRDIVRAIALNTGVVMSIAAPTKVPGIDEEVCVSIPQRVGRTLGYTLLESLRKEEREAIYDAARDIYKTYVEALRSLQQS